MHPSLHQSVTKNQMTQIFLLFLPFEKRRGHAVSSFLELWQKQKDTIYLFFWFLVTAPIDETINKILSKDLFEILYSSEESLQIVWQLKSNLVFFASANLKNIPN